MMSDCTCAMRSVMRCTCTICVVRVGVFCLHPLSAGKFISQPTETGPNSEKNHEWSDGEECQEPNFLSSNCCVPPFTTFANAMCLCFCVHSPFTFQCHHNIRGLWPHSFFESLHRASLPTVTSSRHVSSISAWSSASLPHLTFLAILFSRLFPFLPQSSVFPTISTLHFLGNTQ